MAASAPTNAEIGDMLERVADLLEVQDAGRHRIAAYRRGAATVRHHPEPVATLYHEGGTAAVDALPTIGPTLAAHVAELVQTGRLSLLDRLEGEVSPERLFASLPGIGPELGRRIHEKLDVETLEDLELAAHDGRLATVAGFGERRVRALRDQLAALLARKARLRRRRLPSGTTSTGSPAPAAAAPDRPSVATLLALDAEYREKAERGQLRRITPRRFNPRHEAWLPVLHAEREGWHFTLLFSNTARAHDLGRTHDWIVAYYERDGDDGQCTIVTETSGPLRGRRVVRGREAECREPPVGSRGVEASTETR
ncbi:MAG: helix-hairpin-helix domain-containing protein [Myxococcota bacterium]